MLCNIHLTLILLLCISIIGLVIFSNKTNDKNNNEKEGFEDNSSNITFDGLDSAQKIITNNDKINKLLSQLQTLSPDVQLINYDPEKVNLDMQNSITSNVTLLNNDLNTLYTKSLDANTTKINKLENIVNDIEHAVSIMKTKKLTDKKYNTIKSLNNGMEFKLVSTPNTMFKDYKTGSNIAGYMVMANNGCLSVGATDYDIYECNDKNPKQIFKMEHILNETAYQNNIDTSLPVDNIDKSNINYPFVMMKSINNENCLTNNHGYLTVQPCYSFTAQRWFPL